MAEQGPNRSPPHGNDWLRVLRRLRLTCLSIFADAFVIFFFMAIAHILRWALNLVDGDEVWRFGTLELHAAEIVHIFDLVLFVGFLVISACRLLIGAATQ